MRRFAISGVVVALLASANVARADDFPKLPGPVKEHEWLLQLAGEWESECEMVFEPGKPPFKCKGTATVRSIGGFWVLGENRMDIMGKTMTGIMTIGFDPEKKKYTGTWVDSHTSYLWNYVGTLDADGKVLTLAAEGPNPMAPGKMSKFKDAIEIKAKDHKVLTSTVQGEDGKWVTFMTVNYRRKK